MLGLRVCGSVARSRALAPLILSSCAFGVLLAGCGTSSSSSTGDHASSDASGNASGGSQSLPKSFVANLTEIGSVTSKGDDVAIGYIPGPNGGPGQFSIGGTTRINGKRRVEVMAGPVGGLVFKPGATAEGAGLVKVWTSETESTDYSSLAWWLFYPTTAGNKESIAHMQLSRAERLGSDNPMTSRYHLVGTFQFNAAYQPDSLSDACMKEAQMASIKAARIPMYNPSLCNSKKTVVTGSFDIVQDFVKTAATP